LKDLQFNPLPTTLTTENPQNRRSKSLYIPAHVMRRKRFSRRTKIRN